jgi:glycerophosphoryl diester phosphodiesterase
VLVTLVAGLASISILSLGPGSLTSHASARALAQGPTTPAPPAVARPKTPAVVPHRIQVIGLGGGSDWGPPNSLAAIQNAVAAGVEGVEVDVRFLSDGLPVVLPDGVLTRSSDCTGPIATVTFSRLSQCGLAGPRDASTLDAVLNRLARGPQRVYLYLPQTDSLAAAQRVVSLVARYRLNDSTRLTLLSPSTRILEQLRAAGAGDLGLVFRGASGWISPYRVLVVLAAEASAAQVADAQRRGHFVIVAADSRAALTQVPALRPNGVMAHEVGGLLR